MEKKYEIKINGRVFYTLLTFCLLIGLSVFINAVGVVHHNADEVEGTWNIINGKYSYTGGNVGIGTDTPSQVLAVNGDIKLISDSEKQSKILFNGLKTYTAGGSTNEQTQAYLGDYYCPPSFIGGNWFGGQYDENLFHNGCENMGDGVVKVKSIRGCTDRFSLCRRFRGASEADQDKLCQFLGFSSAKSANIVTEQTQYNSVLFFDFFTIGGVNNYLKIQPSAFELVPSIVDIECNVK